jgi:hypothetical protein
MDRTPQLSDYGISRRGLFKSSLAVGLGATGLAAAGTALTAGAAQAASVTTTVVNNVNRNALGLATTYQVGWRYCKRCRNLYYSGDKSLCYDGGAHAAGSTTNYGVAVNNPGFSTNDNGDLYQSPWTWCSNCGCIYWGNGNGGWCVGSAKNVQLGHNSNGSGVYFMALDTNGSSTDWYTDVGGSGTLQPLWRYCRLCMNLYWGNAWSASVCVYNFFNSQTTNNHATGNSVYYLFMP